MSRLAELCARLEPSERAAWLAELGRYDASDDESTRIARLASAFATCDLLGAIAHHPTRLAAAYSAACEGSGAHKYPGRCEALLAVARALSRTLPASEYALPEVGLDALLERARDAEGKRVPALGKAGHKGRVGDAVERMLIGHKVIGKVADHAAAEIKSVPVTGDRVIERVKLGVISRGSNPLDKCDRVLFVFVEQRGDDHFVRGHACVEFDHERFSAMWERGELVETAAGKDGRKTRGLYLTPKWFRSASVWPR